MQKCYEKGWNDGSFYTHITEDHHIYDKIMELDPGEIERLVNKAIKREMNYLVYLGALLGFIIGIINIFV